MANLFEDQLGFYLFDVKISDPNKIQFVISWKNNCQIDDVMVGINKNKKIGMRELIVSYK